MNIQTILLGLVSLLVILDAYITYATYKQTEKDYTKLKYDLAAFSMRQNLIKIEVNYHKDHIAALQKDSQVLSDRLAKEKP